MKRELELIRLMGWRDWVWYSLRLDEITQWFERVYYCHRNARVIEDFEERMSGVIWYATDGRMSKPYYTEAAMRSEIDDAFERVRAEGYEEGRNDALEEFGLSENEQ